MHINIGLLWWFLQVIVFWFHDLILSLTLLTFKRNDKSTYNGTYIADMSRIIIGQNFISVCLVKKKNTLDYVWVYFIYKARADFVLIVYDCVI